MFKKNPVIKGTLLLTASSLIGRIISFFYKISLSRCIGSKGIGLYQLIFPFYTLTIAFTCSGIQTSISRFVSAKLAANDPGGARKIFHIGLSFSLFVSILFSCCLHIFPQELATRFLHEPECAPLLSLLAFVLPFGSIHACINGYYYGTHRAGIPALGELLEHTVRFFFLLLIIKICAEKHATITPAIAVYAMIAGEFLSALFSSTCLLWQFFSGRIIAAPQASLQIYLQELASMAIPLTLNRTLVSLFQSMEAFFLPLQLHLAGLSHDQSLALYGIFTGMALPLVLFPSALTFSLSTMLLPVISEAQAQKNFTLIHSYFRKLCLLCICFGLFFWFFFFSFGDLLGRFLFQNRLAGSLIRSMAWICPVLYLNPALFAILNGLGKTTLVFLYNLIGVLIRILFVLFSISRFGIHGYIMGIAITQAVLFFLSASSICQFLKQSGPCPNNK